MVKSLQISVLLGLLSFSLHAENKPPKKPNVHAQEQGPGQAKPFRPGHQVAPQEGPAVREMPPPSTHAAPPVVHEAAPPSTHAAPPVVHEPPSAPPSTHAAPPVVHEAAPPSTHATPPVVHEAAPPSTHPTPPVVHVAPPSTHPAPPVVRPGAPSTHPAQPSAPTVSTPQRPVPKVDQRDISAGPNSRVRIPQQIIQAVQAARPEAKHFVPPVFQREKNPSVPVPKQIPKVVHEERVNFAQTRINNVMRTNPQVTQIVNKQTTHWVNTQQPIIERRAPVFRQYFDRYQNWRERNHGFTNQWWYRHRFYGGFYYGFNPIFNVNIYFYNPLVYWFFAPTYEVQYYRTWYGDDIDAYPDFQRPFRYNGLFYQTENLRQLLFAVSAMPIDEQLDFKKGIDRFTAKLAKRLANATQRPVHLSNGDIVVTHYAILNYDDGISLDGFVNQHGEAYNFKGIIDLWDPSTSDSFVAASLDREPSADDLDRLSEINDRISTSGGEVVPDDEPPPPEPVDENDLSAEPDDEY